ncbi:MAG TPA: hypothetical protein VEX13_02955 [Chloroflexia bacterium]|nr:hypothetical protein [Chloroflexia bacterium]
MPGIDDENSERTTHARIQQLQARLNEALQEPIKKRAKTEFSPYAAHLGPDMVKQLHRAAASGGIEGMEAAMDAYDQILESENVDRDRVRHALHLFVTHHEEVGKLGLNVPSQ